MMKEVEEDEIAPETVPDVYEDDSDDTVTDPNFESEVFDESDSDDDVEIDGYEHTEYTSAGSLFPLG
ncbi:hypothetical protein FQR65_LT13778 [Abscondita terminalis]|nr:hypothetical protein FQR65_LT13778 [Abscondita terminalis]